MNLKPRAHRIRVWIFALGTITTGALASSPSVRPVVLMEGFEFPWSMAFINNNEALITERSGSLWLVHVPTRTKKKVSGVPRVAARNQGGLLDIELHPDFAQNAWVFLSFAHESKEGYTTRVERYRFNQEKLQLTQAKEIYTALPFGKETKHFGSRLVATENYLFISIGDRGERERAQQLNNSGGKIIRLNLDGSIPTTNPFGGIKDAKPEIYSLGHRNPQGMAVDRQGNLWVQEHGPRGGDELNRVQAGKNYGWPIITYGKEYWGPSIGEGTSKAGLEQPVHHWTPSIAPSGLLIYSGKQVPEWKNAFLNGALKLQHLNIIKLSGTQVKEERILTQLGERIRDVKEDLQGHIYLLTDSPDGKLIRLEPTALTRKQ